MTPPNHITRNGSHWTENWSVLCKPSVLWIVCRWHHRHCYTDTWIRTAATCVPAGSYVKLLPTPPHLDDSHEAATSRDVLVYAAKELWKSYVAEMKKAHALWFCFSETHKVCMSQQENADTHKGK